MTTYEDLVKAATDDGQNVYYSVTPLYSGNRTVPTGFDMVARGTYPNGTAGISFDVTIDNSLKGRNLGTFVDQNTGDPVPTGSMK